jgi:hypothetical protein
MKKTEAGATYFFRHAEGLDVDQGTWDEINDRKIIALRFPNDKNNKLLAEDNISDAPEEYYGNNKTAMKNFNGLAEVGGYVCVTYRDFDGCVVGSVTPCTPKKIKGFWGALPERPAVLRSLVLSNTREFTKPSSAGILLGCPPYVTISHWPSAKDRVKNLVLKKPPAQELHSLTDYQQEVMVSEFLRTGNAAELGLPRLGSLLTPVGRTMKDIDIAGISEEGSTVFFQVTFSDQKKVIEDKIKSLETYSDGRNELLMFYQTRERKTIGKVEVVPLQDCLQPSLRQILGRSG